MAQDQKHILIVEDDDLITEMYKASLAGSKLAIELEKDGQAGWEAMQKTTPDLVILDFMMPKLNGLEVLAKMRADDKLKNVPTIIMSSLSSDADRKRALDAGATEYWIKNEVNMVEFETRINSVLNK